MMKSYNKASQNNTALHTKIIAFCALGLIGISLAGCGGGMPSLSDMNPFKEVEKPLPGQRIAVMAENSTLKVEGTPATRNVAIAMPAPMENGSWSQPGGLPNNAPGHLALAGGLKTVWSTSAGKGSSSDGRLVASPIVHNGKIFTLDAYGQIYAFSAGSGNQVWKASTTPESEKEEEGFGGGIAIDGSRLYAATGYGQVVAFDLGSGKQVWNKSFGVPFRSSPTVEEGKVYAVNTEGLVVCLSSTDGKELWTYNGLPENASLLNNSSPAVAGNIVVVPFPSGELGAYNVATGEQMWNESLTRRREGAAFSGMNNVARPVIANGIVYAVSHSGRMIAAEAKSGNVLWSLDIASSQTPWVAGEAVFVVDVTGRLAAIGRKDGKVRWVAQLPDSNAWSGPVVAGGKVWVVSGKGLMVGVNATNGEVSSKRELESDVYIPPIVAGNKMFVYTDKAKLIALN